MRALARARAELPGAGDAAGIDGVSLGGRAAGIEHRLDVVGGDHSYAFNRGPGVYEMLLFHDRALRGEPYLP